MGEDSGQGDEFGSENNPIMGVGALYNTNARYINYYGCNIFKKFIIEETLVLECGANWITKWH